MIDVGLNSRDIRDRKKLHDIESILTPDNYCKFSAFDKNDCNDFGLVLLEKPIPFSKYLRPICLPEAEEEFSGKLVSSIGWGLHQVKETKVIFKLL